jgi:ribonuclease Z
MRPRFHPRLINGPFEDPGLYIPFLFENRAVLFDLGDIYALAPKDILKIGHVFVTHTHMDHFIGFDRLLRLFLGREKHLSLCGPQGFFKNAEGKLGGYAWNLVENYQYRLTMELTEVHSDLLITKTYRCRDKFLAREKTIERAFNGVLLEEAGFRVFGVILDHCLPCLGFSIHERFHVNIVREGLNALGLETGPWLSRFKQALYRQIDPDSDFEAEIKDQRQKRKFKLGELAEKIALITPGEKIAYISDVAYSDANKEKIVEFAKDANHLFWTKTAPWPKKSSISRPAKPVSWRPNPVPSSSRSSISPPATWARNVFCIRKPLRRMRT